MKQILSENASIRNIIGKAKISNSGYRLTHYAVAEPVEDGILLFNTLTRELLLLTQEEYDNALENQQLREKWFVVPNDLEEKKLVQLVRFVQKTMNKEKPGLTHFNIYTTTDCNARCFYCFELGRQRIPMSDETAIKTAEFIIKNNNGNPVTINWFGGEPLFNSRVMDIICQKIRDAGISYKTSMITNGYLLNDENVQKCVNLWNMRRIQISMDGTEAVYNKTKRYIYKEGNPFQIVMGNIQRLLDHDISVIVRVNMDFFNAEDLSIFAEQLAERFGGHRRFHMYSYLIIDEKKAWDKHHSLEEWDALYEAKAKLEKKMTDLGIFSGRALRISKKLPYAACMVENDNNIVVCPDGSLGICEHYSETELIGHLDSDERNQAVIDSFRVRWEDIPECDTCFYYTECIRLKKCPYIYPCFEPQRKENLRNTINTMRNEYRFWLGKMNDVDTIEADELK